MWGLFDTSGPTIISIPRYGSINFGKEKVSENLQHLTDSKYYDDFFNSQGDDFLIPIQYDLKEDKYSDNKFLFITRRDTPEFEILGDKSTLIHEGHHLLNLCSSPIGYQLHLSQLILNRELASLLTYLKKDCSNILSLIGSPLISRYQEVSLQPKVKSKIHDFVQTTVNPYITSIYNLYGNIDFEMTGQISKSAIKDQLLSWYSLINNTVGISDSDTIKNWELDDITPVVMVSETGNYSELGAIQLIECIGRLCQVLYIAYYSFIYVHSKADEEERDKFISNLLDMDNENNYKRYLLPYNLTINVCGESCQHQIMTTIFSCWMALFSPICPTTQKLTVKYGLKCDDLHPGTRFMKILNSIKRLKIKFDSSIENMRYHVDEYHDLVANDLKWPSFSDLQLALSVIPQNTTEFFHLFNSDPFFEIYSKLNLACKEVPWCDIFPGREITNEPKAIYIPLIAGEDSIRTLSGDYGRRGLLILFSTKLTNFILFGQKDPLLDILLKMDEELITSLLNILFPNLYLEEIRSQYNSLDSF